jgi:hypothetical protein
MGAHKGAGDKGKPLKNLKQFPKNLILPKRFLFKWGKNVGFHLWNCGGLWKNVKTRSSPSSGLGLSIYVIKRN